MKLLYAEDEPALSEAVVDYLTYHKYIVDAVYDGADAYDYAMSGEYDGIILDIMMPKPRSSWIISVSCLYSLPAMSVSHWIMGFVPV